MWKRDRVEEVDDLDSVPGASRRRRSSLAAPSWPAPIDAETMRMLRRTGTTVPRRGVEGRLNAAPIPV